MDCLGNSGDAQAESTQINADAYKTLSLASPLCLSARESAFQVQS